MYIAYPESLAFMRVLGVLQGRLYSVLYALLLIGEKNPSLIDMKAMLICVISLALVSLLLSLSIFHRLSKLMS